MLEKEKISFGHLQWIYYRQALDGYDSQGNFVQIQHAYFRGEIDFQGLKPDGYLFKDGKHYEYLFSSHPTQSRSFQEKSNAMYDEWKYLNSN